MVQIKRVACETGAAHASAPVEPALPGQGVRPPGGEGAEGDSGGVNQSL